MKGIVKNLFLFLIIGLVSSSCVADEIDRLLKEAESFYSKKDLFELVAQMKAGDTNQKIEATAVLARYFIVMEKLKENEDNMSVNQLKKYLLLGNKVTDNLSTLLLAYSLINEKDKGGTSQTVVIDPTSPYVGKRPVYAYYTSIGTITVATKDSGANKYSVSVTMNLGYDIDDLVTSGELASRQVELRDFVRYYFKNKYAADLVPEKNEQIKREIQEILNTRFLDVAKVRSVMFDKFDVMEIY